MDKLSVEELKRYDRHIILPGFGKSGQEKLKNSKILVVGAGGLGSPVLYYLAAAGIGTIGIVENDHVDSSNLQRQILYDSNNIGSKKVEIAKERLTALNPYVNFEIYDERLTNTNAEKIISKYEIVVDCPDNYLTRLIVSKITKKLEIPHIYGSVSKYEGQLAVFNYKKGPTYIDLFPGEENEKADQEIDPEEKGVLGVLPGVIGSLQANEAIKIITEIGEVLSGKMMVLNMLDLSSYTVEI